MNDFEHKTYEYVTSAGEGTMLSLGVADNLHSAKAHGRIDGLKQAASDGNVVRLVVAPCPADAVTGK